MKHGPTANTAKRLFTTLALVTMLLSAVASPVYADGTWTNQTRTPSARSGPAMAYIGEGKVLLFGGWEGSCDGETWLYDLSDSTWTNKAPATSPPARADHAMAYLGGDRVLLFGGLEDIWEPPLGDTWVYDLSDNTWTEQAPAAAPSAREWHAMAYLGRGQALMFGGFDYDGPNGETWVYDLSDNSWTEQASVAGPSPRYGHAMAALDGDQVLLFGGEPPGVGLSVETWLASGFGVPPFRVYLPLVLK